MLALTVNSEPNRMVTVVPVVECSVVSRYKNRADRPSMAPRTMPVATSRPRRRWTPSSSMVPEATTPTPTKPHSGLTPTRLAAEPPSVPMSESASPANAWPRITVNTPTQPETSATTRPMTSAVWTWALWKNPASNTAEARVRGTSALTPRRPRAAAPGRGPASVRPPR